MRIAAAYVHFFLSMLLITEIVWCLVVPHEVRELKFETRSRKHSLAGQCRYQLNLYPLQLATGVGIVTGPHNSPNDLCLFVPSAFSQSVRRILGDSNAVGAERSPSLIYLSYIPKMITTKFHKDSLGKFSPIMLKKVGARWAFAGYPSDKAAIIDGKEGKVINEANCRLLVRSDLNVVLCLDKTEEEIGVLDAATFGRIVKHQDDEKLIMSGNDVPVMRAISELRKGMESNTKKQLELMQEINQNLQKIAVATAIL